MRDRLSDREGDAASQPDQLCRRGSLRAPRSATIDRSLVKGLSTLVDPARRPRVVCSKSRRCRRSSVHPPHEVSQVPLDDESAPLFLNASIEGERPTYPAENAANASPCEIGFCSYPESANPSR